MTIKQLIEQASFIQKERDRIGQAIADLEAELSQYEKDAYAVADELKETYGVTSISLEDGKSLAIVEKYHLNIKKDLQSQFNVSDWLKENGAGNLVSSEYRISRDAVAKVEALGIHTAESVSMNTTSVKAWLMGKLGKKPGTIAEMTEDDLPAGLSLYKELKLEAVL